MDDVNVLSKPVSKPLRKIISLELPHCAEKAPGPLHTIVTDEDGSIYYSDEMNHSVVSLCRDGSVRWQRTKCGTAPGEFRYPRGLALGYSVLRGKMVRCLAIADAWNRRVQFLDLSGNPLDQWTHGGDTQFGEVADLRFIPQCTNAGSDEAHGIWYVLDRDNHRLFRFGLDGNIINTIGRCFPGTMESRWAAMELFFCGASAISGIIERISPFDFGYYPNRLLGNTEDSLYECESGSRRIKLIRPPHLIRLCVDEDIGLEWIAADRLGLLGWDRDGNRLVRAGRIPGGKEHVDIIGTPIASNLPTNQFWIQHSNGIEKWEWNLASDKENHGESTVDFLLAKLGTAALDRHDPSKVRNAVNDCYSVIDEEIRLGDIILAMSEEYIDQQLLNGMSVHLEMYKRKCSYRTAELRESLHNWCLGQLGCHLSQTTEIKAVTCFPEQEKMQSRMIIDLRSRMASIQERIVDLNAGLLCPQESIYGTLKRLESWRRIAAIAESGLEYAKDWISQWSGITMDEESSFPKESF